MDDLTNPNPAGAAAATPSATEPATATSGTVQPNGAANGQSASVEEMFGNVDPKTLPPQLKSVYDNMLRGFKEKTTKVAETVKSEVAKATEAYRQKAEFYDQVAQQEEFVKMWNEHVQKATQSQPANDADPKLTKFEQELQAVKMELQTAKTLEVINAFAEAKSEAGDKLHPDFDKLSGFKLGTHQRAGEYDLLRTAIELAPGNTPQEKMENGYKAAKATYDAIFEEGKKAGMGRIQDKVRRGSMAPSSSSSPQSIAARPPKNALEALEFARQGLAPAK